MIDKDALLGIYRHLPACARTLAAGVYGYYIRSWRYDGQTERLVAEAMERESWSAGQWSAWREERLARLLHRAATQVPYYRDWWSRKRQQGLRRSWERLDHWPVLEKDAIRQNPRAFVADDCNVHKMFSACTSGTTGTAIALWFSRDALRQHYALFEARCRIWNGLSRHDHWANLGTQLVVPVHVRRPPFWVWNRGMRQLYLSLHHLGPDTIASYLDALKAYQVRYLYGFPGAMHRLALGALRQGRRDVKLQAVVSNAEPLFDYQRQVIAEAFGCPVRETYGMGEICAAASECPQGRLHLWPDAGVVEVLHDGQPVSPGTSGDLVCTGLLNADMPLIRYRLGDRGSLASAEETCSCGRTLPLVASLDGRDTDIIYTPDGRFISKLEPVFCCKLPICEAQVVQETLHRLRVLYVPAPEFAPKHREMLIENLARRVGGMEIVPQSVEEIPRTPSGKFRLMVCNLPASQRAALDRGARGRAHAPLDPSAANS